MDATLAALLGAMIGGALSVLASWLAQRIQSKSLWLSQETQRRQHLYSQFVEAAACCFGDALLEEEPDTTRLAQLYGEMGRMRLVSTEPVLREANRVAHKILDTYGDPKRSRKEVRDLLAHDSVDLFSDFGDACRAELIRLQPLRVGIEGPSMFRLTPIPDAAASS
jgi:hypothetical protein